MSILTFNMNDYEIVNNDVCDDQYDEEVMNANWTPELALQPYVTTPDVALIPSDLASVDVEAFLQKMYSYQE